MSSEEDKSDAVEPQIINADAIHGYDDMGTKAHPGGEQNEEHCGNPGTRFCLARGPLIVTFYNCVEILSFLSMYKLLEVPLVPLLLPHLARARET